MERSPGHWSRYERVDGELLVTPAPAPRHQLVQGELFVLLKAYVDAHRLGHALSAPADIALDPERKSLLQPDIFIVPAGGVWPPRTWRDIAALGLAVEILSPSAAPYDHGLKRRYYQRYAVSEYWIFDPDEEVVERWHRSDEEPELVRDRLSWRPEPAVPALEIDLPILFREVLGNS